MNFQNIKENVSEKLTGMGFDMPRLGFTLRTAITACVALVISWALGLEHPQWSAMTVWAASLPTRGQLVEKGMFRFAGTISGVIAGVSFVLMSQIHPSLLVLGLAIWIGLCACIGNLQRGYVSYGTMLAGYSAAMVALLGTGNPGHIFELGLDRLFTIMVGVISALISGLIFAKKLSEDELSSRIRNITMRVFRVLAQSQSDNKNKSTEINDILYDMAAIEEKLEAYGAGSVGARNRVRSIRILLSSLMTAILWVKRSDDLLGNDDVSSPKLAQALIKTADAIEKPLSPNEILAALNDANNLAKDNQILCDILIDITAALKTRFAISGSINISEPLEPINAHQIAMHYDWVGAKQAGIRAFMAIFLSGMLWLVSGIDEIRFMILGLAIMISLFSTFDNPIKMMRIVFWGQVMGVCGAFVCHWLVWQFVTNETQMVISMMPFIILGAFIMAHQKTLGPSFDYNMTMLLLLQPAYPPITDFGSHEFIESLITYIGVISAPMVALVAYKFIFPVNSNRRMDILITMMVHELRDIAAKQTFQKSHIWRARLYHRILRLISWTQKNNIRDFSAIDGGLTVLGIGNGLMRIWDILAAGEISKSQEHALKLILARISEIDKNPKDVAYALETAARYFEASDKKDAMIFYNLATAINDNEAFFRYANKAMV